MLEKFPNDESYQVLAIKSRECLVSGALTAIYDRDRSQKRRPHENEWKGGRGIYDARKASYFFPDVESVSLDDIAWHAVIRIERLAIEYNQVLT